MRQITLVDTRNKARHCRFVAWLMEDLGGQAVAVTTLCPACKKALKMTLKLAGFGHLPIVEV